MNNSIINFLFAIQSNKILLADMKSNLKSKIQLITPFRNSYKTRFESMYNEYVSKLEIYGMHLTSDNILVKDTIQELFIDIWKNRKKLDEIKNIKSYILSSFRYKLFRQFENNKRQIATFQSIEESCYNINYKPVLEVDDASDFQLKKHINELPKRQKEVIHLKYYQKLSHKEIGGIMEINLQSVSNLLSRAISSLRKKNLKKYSA